MADTKEGILQQLPSGRWAVFRPGRAPVENLLLDWLMNDTTNIVSVWLKQL